ncbi:MAG: hypothetical protein E6R04_10690 [Spirochaetes bacterium]|nr:MAG: hypothetical protein E6R04_10690 [Spirochaetota bacterium]
MRKLLNEDEILSMEFRKQVIEEIRGKENIERKLEALKRYEVFNDNVKKWVIQELSKEFSSSTVRMMENRATNISFLKKIIKKIATCYNAGVSRTLENDADQEALNEMATNLQANKIGKKRDRYLSLFRNTLCQISYRLDTYESMLANADRYRIFMRELTPDLYDVIEDSNNPEIPRVVILSDFVDQKQVLRQVSASERTGRRKGQLVDVSAGDGRDQAIADTRADKSQENGPEFIWTSAVYHFTTDHKGNILANKSPEGLLNPIKMLNYAWAADGQDGNFWATGGQDLTDGAIHANKLLTDMNTIASVQGWGQPVAKGKDLPKVIEGGPHKLITLNYEDGDPVPDFDYKTSSPPIDLWMRMIEQFVALYLSTNDVAPTSISGSLDASSFPSGIADLVDRSKYTGDRDDREGILQDAERQQWLIVQHTHNYLKERKALVPDQAEIDEITDTKVSVEFLEPKPTLSEKESLEVLKMRKEIGLNREVELIMRDRGIEDEKQAEKILMEIKAEKLENAAAMGLGVGSEDPAVDENGDPLEADPNAQEEKPAPPIEKKKKPVAKKAKPEAKA